MGRVAVRQAVANFFAPPAVPLLGHLYTSTPKRVPGPEFRKTFPAGTQSGAIAIVNLISEREKRIAVGGEHSGRKRVYYDVMLSIKMHSVHTHSEDAMNDFDTLIDTVKDKLRSDRRLNAPDVIWEAGEGSLMGEYSEPEVMADGSTIIWGAVTFEVSEVLAT